MLHLAKEPKYIMISEKIREDILSGTFPPGAKLPPDEVIGAMREVGDKMDVSLRETGMGGVAATPFGQAVSEKSG